MKKLKKLLISIFTVLMLTTTISPVAAETVSIKETSPNPNWSLKVTPWGGHASGTAGSLTVGGENAFCIESDIQLTSKTGTRVSYSSYGISAKQAKTLALLQYYGTHNYGSNGWAMAQNFVWYYCYKQGINKSTNHMYAFISSSTYNTWAKVEAQYNKAMDWVDEYDTYPSFNQKEYEIKVGETLRITDTNKVLKNYNVSSSSSAVSVSKDGNDLVIEVVGNINDKVLITYTNPVSSVLSNTNFVVNTNSQDLGVFTYADPRTRAIQLNVQGNTKVEVTKTDSETGSTPQNPSGSFVGAKFNIKDDSGSVVDTITTDASGKGTSKELPLPDSGYYTVCEVTAPSDYDVNTNCQKVQAVAGQTVKVTISDNIQKGQIKVLKRDAQTGATPQGSATLAGAKIEIYNKAGSVVDTLTTDSKGEATSKMLPVGTYTVKEVTAPNGYDINVTANTVTVTKGGIAETTITDEVKKGNVEVSKLDAETGNTPQGDASFEGISFSLNATGYDEEILTIGSGSNTQKSSTYYAIGTTVKVCEVTTNDSYLLNTNCQDVVITNTGTNTTNPVSISDDVVKGRIEVVKMIPDGDPTSDVEIPAPNFTFEIYLKSSNTLVDTITTDEQGRAISKDLPYGTYTVKEQGDANGVTWVDGEAYQTLAPFDVTISSNDQTILKIVSNSLKTSMLKVVKLNGDTKVPVKGMTFELYDDEGNLVEMEVNYPTHQVISQFTTSDDGTVELPQKLKWGTYTLKEVGVPDGLLNLQGGEIQVVIDQDGVIEVEVTNEAAHGTITINKTVQLLNAIVTSETEYGTLYTPAYINGYLADTTWDIYAKEDIVASDINNTILYNKGDLVETLTTVSDSPVTSKELPLGKYEVKEKTTVDGYVLDTNVYDIELKYAGADVALVSENITSENLHKKFTIDFTKIFEFDEGDYSEVVFGLYSSDSKIYQNGTIPEDGLVAIVYLDDQGKPTNLDELMLPEGDYYLRELATDPNYELDTNKYELTLDYDSSEEEVITVALKDPITNIHKRFGTLKLLKTADMFTSVKEVETEYGTAYNPVWSKGNLANVEFDLYTSDDVLVSHLKTDANGNASYTDLDVGKYYITEIKTADGYLLDDTKYEFEVTYRQDVYEDIIEITLDNEPQDLNVNLNKTFEDNAGNFSDVKFGLYAKNDITYTQGEVALRADTLIAVLGLDDTGKLIWNVKVPAGNEYYLKELSTSEGYVLSDKVFDIDFRADDSLDLMNIGLGTIENDRRRIDVSVVKNGDNGVQKLNGAEFSVYAEYLGEERYVGDFVSGGIVLQGYEGTVYQVSQDPNFESEWKEYTIPAEERLVITDLEDGVYYSRIKPQVTEDQPSEDLTDEIQIPDATDTSDESTDEASPSVPATPITTPVKTHYVSDGMIYLNQIEYATKLRLVETKAPEGYRFIDPEMIIEVKTSYGVDQLEAERINNVIIVPPGTSVPVHYISPFLLVGLIGVTAAIVTVKKKLKRSN